MKNITKAGFLLFFSLMFHFSNAQTVVLINGEATEVTLNGSEIESVVGKVHSNYLIDFDLQSPESNFYYQLPEKLRNTRRIIAFKDKNLFTKDITSVDLE